jgi:hypothetical protein
MSTALRRQDNGLVTFTNIVFKQYFWEKNRTMFKGGIFEQNCVCSLFYKSLFKL